MKHKFQFKISTGITSILMIFVVLSLTAFGVLSYTSADADLKLSRKNSQNIEKFYEADSSCQRAIAMLDGIMNKENEVIIENVCRELEKEIDSCTYSEEQKELVLIKNLNEKQSLEVVIEILQGEKKYNITGYKLVERIEN